MHPQVVFETEIEKTQKQYELLYQILKMHQSYCAADDSKTGCRKCLEFTQDLNYLYMKLLRLLENEENNEG